MHNIKKASEYKSYHFFLTFERYKLKKNFETLNKNFRIKKSK